MLQKVDRMCGKLAKMASPKAAKVWCRFPNTWTGSRVDGVQGYLAHKKQPTPGTLQLSLGPYGGPGGGGAFLMSEVPLYPAHKPISG